MTKHFCSCVDVVATGVDQERGRGDNFSNVSNFKLSLFRCDQYSQNFYLNVPFMSSHNAKFPLPIIISIYIIIIIIFFFIVSIRSHKC